MTWSDVGLLTDQGNARNEKAQGEVHANPTPHEVDEEVSLVYRFVPELNLAQQYFTVDLRVLISAG